MLFFRCRTFDSVSHFFFSFAPPCAQPSRGISNDPCRLLKHLLNSRPTLQQFPVECSRTEKPVLSQRKLSAPRSSGTGTFLVPRRGTTTTRVEISCVVLFRAWRLVLRLISFVLPFLGCDEASSRLRSSCRPPLARDQGARIEASPSFRRQDPQ